MSLQAIVRAISLIVCGALAISIRDRLSSAGVDWTSANIVGITIGVLIAKALEFALIWIPRRIPVVRWLLDPSTRIEGFWYEHVREAGDNPYTVASIRYVPSENSFSYEGVNFKPQLTLNATFVADEVMVTRTGRDLKFSFAATVHREDGPKEVTGFGQLRLYADSGFRPHSGEGKFYDTLPEGETIRMRTLELRRIRRSYIKKALGHYPPRNSEEKRLVLEKFLSDNPPDNPPDEPSDEPSGKASDKASDIAANSE